jgi:hypothetical protein
VLQRFVEWLRYLSISVAISVVRDVAAVGAPVGAGGNSCRVRAVGPTWAKRGAATLALVIHAQQRRTSLDAPIAYPGHSTVYRDDFIDVGLLPTSAKGVS